MPAWPAEHRDDEVWAWLTEEEVAALAGYYGSLSVEGAEGAEAAETAVSAGR